MENHCLSLFFLASLSDALSIGMLDNAQSSLEVRLFSLTERRPVTSGCLPYSLQIKKLNLKTYVSFNGSPFHFLHKSGLLKLLLAGPKLFSKSISQSVEKLEHYWLTSQSDALVDPVLHKFKHTCIIKTKI